MKQFKLAFLIAFLFILPGLKAQQNHFIYIQTDDKQPFYVKLDKKIYSSSASGYLVVPKLKQGTYNIAIGFPKNEWTEQNLSCTVGNDDIGYLLKNFESRGWGLFNLQTMAVLMPGDTTKPDKAEVINKTDAFSNMLSSVVNDSTIRQTEKIKEEVKKVPVREEEKGLTVATKEKEAAAGQAIDGVKISEAGNEQANEINNSRSVITRSLFNKNADGTEMVFVDDINGKKDTVRVFIPAGKNSNPAADEKAANTEKAGMDRQPAVVKKEGGANGAKFLNMDVAGQSNKTEEKKRVDNIGSGEVQMNTANEKKPEPSVEKMPMINSDCKSYASEDDFLKLRKKMVAQDNDDDMITLAKKIFKSKCFTVEQVKNLSVLFLKDSGKYAFFDMTYPFVSDSHNFSSLQSQLSEAYYINRFQVMIHH